MLSKFKNYFKKIPLIGGIVECSLSNHKSALNEFILTLFFSLSPILIAIIVDHYTKNILFWDSIFNNVSNGELFIYSTSLLAPVFYTIMNEKGEVKKFPRKSSSIFVYGGLMFISAIVYSLQKANVILQKDNLFRDSIFIFAFSNFLLYLIIVYNNNRVSLNPTQEMQNQEDEFLSKFNEHRG